MSDTFLEFATVEEADDVSVAALKARCKANGKSWPEQLDGYVPGRWHQSAESFNSAHPGELRTKMIEPRTITKTGGATLKVTPDMDAVSGGKELVGGKLITVDTTTAKTPDKLSADAQEVLSADGVVVAAVVVAEEVAVIK